MDLLFHLQRSFANRLEEFERFSGDHAVMVGAHQQIDTRVVDF